MELPAENDPSWDPNLAIDSESYLGNFSKGEPEVNADAHLLNQPANDGNLLAATLAVNELDHLGRLEGRGRARRFHHKSRNGCVACKAKHKKVSISIKYIKSLVSNEHRQGQCSYIRH